MASNVNLMKLVPGFEFLHSLMENAGAGVPGFGQWIAPTLDVEELDKRIEQLRTVLFWLEQNERLLKTSIQALEVQRMTVSTLQSMNMPMVDLADALAARVPNVEPKARAPAPAWSPAPAPVKPPAAADEPEPRAEVAAPDAPPAATGTEPPATMVDPTQWWTALTQQFGELATKAMKDVAAETSSVMTNAKASGPQAPAKAPARKRASKKAKSKATKDPT